MALASCDPNHQNEFYRIDRSDIEGYEQFISKYPSSTLVKDARERIETEKENRRIQAEIERAAEQQRQLESRYGNNSLSNGSAPYARWYGNNLYFDDYTPHSEIQVTAPSNSDVIVIVRYNNQNGNVAGHKYITAGNRVTIYLKNGYNYQTFFYYGKGWYPQKEMKGKRVLSPSQRMAHQHIWRTIFSSIRLLFRQMATSRQAEVQKVKCSNLFKHGRQTRTIRGIPS